MREIIKIEKLPLNNAEIEKWEEAREKCLFNFSEVENLDKKMIIQLLEQALTKIDELENNFENDERDIFDIVDDKLYEFDKLFEKQIEVLKAYYLR